MAKSKSLSRNARAHCGVGLIADLDGTPTHNTIRDGLQILANLDHRSARGAEHNTGDGAGVLFQKPHEFFASQIDGLGDFDDYGVGMVFFPMQVAARNELVAMMERICFQQNFEIVAWREVPTDNSSLGATALAGEPLVEQFFVKPTRPVSARQLDINLFVLRRLIEKQADTLGYTDGRFYICSLDRRKIVYKGMLTCNQVKSYYLDLSDERVTSSLILVHSRFSTNTLGAWDLAHPYRCLVHNGEINTIRGNKNWFRTREAHLASDVFGNQLEDLKPFVRDDASDTAAFDNVLELLVESGRDLPHALRFMVPEAWHKNDRMDERRRAFYDYHSTLMEPWDGPALIAGTDGFRIAAALDRNGLRPCRYRVTTDNRFIMASEAGVLDTPPSEILFTERLRPGQLLMVDTVEGRLIPEEEIFDNLTKKPYGEWLKDHRIRLNDIKPPRRTPPKLPPYHTVMRLQKAFGYDMQTLQFLVQPMAETGKDPIGSMGADTPPAVLSEQTKPLFNYFRQLFAQVSNPPLDFLREDLVTSLESHMGQQRNLLEESPEHCRRLQLRSPILSNNDLTTIKEMDGIVKSTVVPMVYDRTLSLREAITHLCVRTAERVLDGHEMVVLSDRSINVDKLPIPSLLAVAAVHHYLIRRGVRGRCGLVVECGDASTVHHAATLLGYGADAMLPWVAYQSIASMVEEDLIPSERVTAVRRYQKALEQGLLKVMSKMGVSTFESYKGAQLFEAIGLDQDFVDEYFVGTDSHLGGVGVKVLERELRERHKQAFMSGLNVTSGLDHGGDLFWRRSGEMHQWNPLTLAKLQQAVRENDGNAYREFAHFINEQDERLQTLRGMLEFDVPSDRAIPLSKVEPATEILKRFFSAPMSFGALSQEAHEALAIAMNRLGGKADSGEGGEQVDRFGTERQCTMKQVASGRFGVTIQYLNAAKDIEIKMAQGSKPGEGGELPGHKVDEGIAAVRFTVPGVGLISPPPHHDIYSIEDLAQLIHDLKCANPDANVHVKLVSTGGVGVIAAGVAKAKADSIVISGDSGGTGASVKTSIHSAGSPWEIGLAEAQRILVANRLRSRIRLRADGGFKTGRDVVVAALFGAEEYGFGTAPLVALGCVMLRKCHCNTCSVGIATQNPELRKRFAGKPEHVMTYLRFVAEEVRQIMANLGFRRLDDMIGRIDLLKQKDFAHPKGIKVDLDDLLEPATLDDTPRWTTRQDHQLKKQLDYQLMSEMEPALESLQRVQIETKVANRHRSVGTYLSSMLTKAQPDTVVPRDLITIHCRGSAGQSFGAFLAQGINLHLKGDANDHVGKGLSGGLITITKPADASYDAGENVAIGNVALYGATGGALYVNGQAGERFAVRNSAAISVVEGVGDHACEYMTGGIVLILGPTGKNFGAGMSGGEAFVLNEQNQFEANVNLDTVHVEPVSDDRDLKLIKRMIENHYIYTQSEKAKWLLDNWPVSAEHFAKVVPGAYAAVVKDFIKKGNDIRLPVPPRAVSPEQLDAV